MADVPEPDASRREVRSPERRPPSAAEGDGAVPAVSPAVPAPRSVAVARWVSIVGHPFVLAPVALAVLVLRRLPFAHALPLLVFLIGGSLVPTAAYTLRQVRRGRWSDWDVSRRTERHRLYAVALPLLVLLLVTLVATRQPGFVVRATAAAVGLVAVGSLLNLRLKVSLHCAFAAFAAGLVLPAAPGAGLALVALAPLVAWSRLVLGRHSLGEAAAGLVLGALAAVAVAVAEGLVG